VLVLGLYYDNMLLNIVNYNSIDALVMSAVTDAVYDACFVPFVHRSNKPVHKCVIVFQVIIFSDGIYGLF